MGSHRVTIGVSFLVFLVISALVKFFMAMVYPLTWIGIAMLVFGIGVAPVFFQLGFAMAAAGIVYLFLEIHLEIFSPAPYWK
jgi:hypothetical protein